ncbi:T9SS type A sorting domain-containing protein [uncultured Imperialibacter sp.]|uniref:T9SS type A sorting domain-containing protein n=1 Tax=uncultured Imperialibacter sp. TaxID=1672639 RepID=UPI0030DC7A43|tara:strand:+ start:15730 stop:18204 length:2475 start_codon:yes stop_codon:yes gene_type:complete
MVKYFLIGTCLFLFFETDGQGFDVIQLSQGEQSIAIEPTWADFDNDGDLDFVYESTASRPKSVYSVYVNQEGAYTKVSEFTALGLAEILVYDHNQDGFLDLVLWDTHDIETYVNSSLNFTFSETQVPGLPPGNYDRHIAGIKKGSFSDDNLDDLVIVLAKVTTWPEVKLSTDILINDKGVYYINNVAPPETTSRITTSINVIDIDHDGLLDFQLGLNIVMSKTDGFQLLADAIPVPYAKQSRWEDFDGDGDLDVAVLFSEGSLSTPKLSVLVNNSLSFNVIQDIATNTESFDWVDWDSDGAAEIVTYLLRQDLGWAYDIQFYEYNGAQFVVEQTNPFNLDKSHRAYFIDSDLDGDLDVVTSGPIKYYKNNNKVYDLVSENRLSSLLFNGGAVFSDMDGDGDDDLLVVNSYRAAVFENNAGEFIQKNTLDKETAQSIHWVDIDSDSDLDYLYLVEDAAAVYLVLFENFDGAYIQRQKTEVHSFANDWSAFRLQLLDFDIDGDQDAVVVVADGSVDHRTLLLINNSNVFSIVSGSELPDAIDVRVLDVDNDQRDDIVLWTNLSPVEIVVLVKADTGFDQYTINAEEHFFERFNVFAVDFNNDGTQDLIIDDFYVGYESNGYSVTDRPLALLPNETYIENNRINFVYDHDLDGLCDIISISGFYDFNYPPADPFRGNLYLWENKGGAVWNNRYKIASQLFPPSIYNDKYFYPIFFNNDDYVDFLIFPYESVLLNNGRLLTSVKDDSVRPERIKVFPNPAAEKVFFQMPGKVGIGALSIFTIDGRVVWEESGVSQAFYELTVSGYQKGIYLYRIEASAGIFNGRFIVE